jgi:GAF domain-containing protein
MAMRATTVRFGDGMWRALEQESAREGVSCAQFVRDAALMRMAWLAGRRGDEQAVMDLAALAERGRARATSAEEALATPRRLEALRRSGLLDAEQPESLRRLARLASTVLNAPVALVTLVEPGRQFFTACHGLGEPWASARQTPLSHSFCQHPVLTGEPLVVSDARQHARVRDNLAIPDIDVIAYLGAPIVTRDGERLGTLCVIDHVPRQWTSEQVEIVSALAASAATEIDLLAS